ncbi:MAG: class I SAM-dependent methyltransferase [Ginsengibacter sp.]
MKKSSLLDPDNSKSINQKFRENRFAFFRELLSRIQSDKPIEILDIGGTQSYWESMNFTEGHNANITLLNLYLAPVKYPNFSSIAGDACDLSNFGEDHFDIIFSNSVIEHLFTYENQMKMAKEIRRVGKYYYVQTPNYYFPIEPHWLFPLFQFFPFNMKVALTKNFNLGNYKKSKTREAAMRRVNEVQLLTEKEMKTLFPEGLVYREKFLGLTKSVTIYNFPKI